MPDLPTSKSDFDGSVVEKLSSSQFKNPFDKTLRNQSVVRFVDFNNLATENNQYKPALIQKEQQKEALADQPPPSQPAAASYSSSGTHFIHKKQSQCNIRRSAGVSYVKKSESKQVNVRANYEKLAPIVIQGSYHLPKSEDPATDDLISQICCETLFSEGSYLLCSAFESANEVTMKKYLLKPHRRRELCKGNLWLVRANGLNECWRFIKDKYFLCVHLKYDEERLLRNISPEDLKSEEKILDFIRESDVCLGLLTKRGNASIKSMIKVYKLDSDILGKHSSELGEYDLGRMIGCDGAQIQGINTLGLMMRLELYVDEARWKSLEGHKNSQIALNTFVSSCEE